MFKLNFSADYSNINSVEKFVGSLMKGEEIMLQTSGSTGKPKQLFYPATLLKISASKTNNFFDFNPSTQALLCMSTDAIAGKMMLTRALVGNYSISIANPSKRPLENVNQQVDFIAMVPLQLRESLMYDVEKLKKIPVILIGGGPIPSELVNLLKENRITVYHSFGMTETVSHIALRKVGYQNEDYFQALDGVHFTNQNGQLVIHSIDLNLDELITNDLVNLISPTSFEWLGRKDFVINSGGYKLHPESLEEKWTEITTCPLFIWKEKSEKWGEKMVLYFEGMECPKLNKDDLIQYFKAHELPKVYYLVEHFVYTESGKLDRIKTVAQNSKICNEETF